jgi:hypothetical protein
MKEHGVNNCELARKLKVRETVIRRMLDPDHATKTREDSGSHGSARKTL